MVRRQCEVVTVIATVLFLFFPVISEGTIVRTVMDGGPTAPAGVGGAEGAESKSAVMLNGVPTSRWTYGCSATAAGMIFGYYDRNDYSNMYAGPANGRVAPLRDLGSQTSLIATKKGF